MVNQDDQTIRPETLLEFSDPQYLDPSPTELRTLLSRANLTGAKAGDLVGVNGRTIRKWTGGERAIPYAAWRLLLKETGEVPQRVWIGYEAVGTEPFGPPRAYLSWRHGCNPWDFILESYLKDDLVTEIERRKKAKERTYDYELALERFP